MWFKNIRAYRLTSPFTLSPEQLGEQLSQRAFQPCGKSQALAIGWVPPLGDEAAGLVHAARSQGIATCEINLNASDNAQIFDDRVYGEASTTVPQYVAKLLNTA